MWLLDANMPLPLVALLGELGVKADSAVSRGWNTLSNGALVKADAEADFAALLTRDRLFRESAARALKVHNEFCIVRITLPQLRASHFLAAFRAEWRRARHISCRPFDYVPGRAGAARSITYLGKVLADMRRALL